MVQAEELTITIGFHVMIGILIMINIMKKAVISITGWYHSHNTYRLNEDELTALLENLLKYIYSKRV